jgi:L-alanine-DL-glutamate epimerase-like enolase superfamily enzyme
MNIVSVESFARPEVGFVRVRAEDGLEGWGQLSPYNADVSALVLHRQVARYALGREESEIAAVSERCIEGEYKFPGSYVCRALAGLDTALWDLRGKREGKPVCELLAAPGADVPREIPVYGSSMRRDITPEAEAERLVRLQGEQGFRAFKIRVGKVCGHDQDEWPGRTEALVPTVRRAIGDAATLLVDGNSCYTPARAIEVGQLLKAHGVGHFEEPCPYWELEWTAEVAAALEVPVAGGEQDTDLAQFRRMLRMRAVDIVQPDVCYVGGVTRAREVAAFAETLGVPCTPHSANLSMVTLFTAHLMAAIPNAGPFMEYSIEPTPWARELFSPALGIHDGAMPIPEGPGWGVTLNPAWLESAERHQSAQ